MTNIIAPWDPRFESRPAGAYSYMCRAAFRAPFADLASAEAYRQRHHAGMSDPHKVVLCCGEYFVVSVTT